MDSKIKYGLGGAAGLYLGAYLLFAGKFFLEGYGITPPWIYWFDEVLGWWILFWSILIFGCCYALRKEFLTLKSGLTKQFPTLPPEIINKNSKHLFAVKYVRIILPFLCLLPIAYICHQMIENKSFTPASWTIIGIFAVLSLVGVMWINHHRK